MSFYKEQIEGLRAKNKFLEGEAFVPAKSGTNYKVFLSKNYVLRFRNDNKDLCKREYDFLKDFPRNALITECLFYGDGAMIQKRLKGENVDTIWKTLDKKVKDKIVEDILKFLVKLKSSKNKHYYSVNTGYKNDYYYNLVLRDKDGKVLQIKKEERAKKLLDNILAILDDRNFENYFDKRNISLVHGDLIIHNLLTDGKKLTGILDWEFAMYGDSDYDLARIFYYDECAKAYMEKGEDSTFESGFTDKLKKMILKSGLIKDLKSFKVKYKFIRTVFFLNSLVWAVNSKNPKKNIEELEENWEKGGKVRGLVEVALGRDKTLQILPDFMKQ